MKSKILASLVLLLASSQCYLGGDGFHIEQCNKRFTPYCGQRIETFAVRRCHTACDCQYSDEFCNQGICDVDQRVYEHFKCPESYPV